MRAALTATTAALACFAASGCKPSETSPAPPPATATVTAAPSPTPTLQKKISAAEWRKALTSAYAVSGQPKVEDGVEEFTACFGELHPGAKNDCPAPGAVMLAKRDAFQKSYKFQGALAAFEEVGAKYSRQPSVFLSPLALVHDCDGKPSLVARVMYGGSGWMFLRKFAVLADGEVVLQREFSREAISRETIGSGVEESAVAPLEPSEIDALRKILDAKELTVRVTGDKGYVTMTPKQTLRFRQVVQDSFRAFDALENSLKPVAEHVCS